MARYLVTGGAGFIGSHLCETLLDENHSVRVLDNLSSGHKENLPTKIELIKGDLADKALLDNLMSDVDGCFHLAALASVVTCNQDWLKAHKINLTNTLQVIDCARGNHLRKPIPVVFASSAAVYGDSLHFPIKESDPAMPISVYGVNKLCCEYYTRIASELFQVPCTGLRLFNVFGPRQSPDSSYSGIITRFLYKLQKHEPLTIYGSGEQTRDFIFVKDVARFFLAAMQKTSKQMKIYNVCSGRSTSINQLAEILQMLYRKKLDIHFEPDRVGDIKKSLGNPELASKELGVKAEVSIAEGLKELLSH